MWFVARDSHSHFGLVTVVLSFNPTWPWSVANHTRWVSTHRALDFLHRRLGIGFNFGFGALDRSQRIGFELRKPGRNHPLPQSNLFRLAAQRDFS